MISNADITIFALAVSEDRREVLVPTTIAGVCWYDVKSVSIMSRDGASRNSSAKYIIRIPADAEIQNERTYLPEQKYKKLSAGERDLYWTIQKNAYVLKGMHADVDSMEKLRAVSEDYITIIEYADNTIRGSDWVKHWRIGGA